MKIKGFVCSILVVVIAVSVGLPLSGQEPEEEKRLFQVAQSTFNRGLELQNEEKKIVMLKAANQFETLVEQFGVQNGFLYYNIGNAYYEAGEKGKAVLYYKKAERLIPGFPDLKYNLEIVRQELKLPEVSGSWWKDITQSILFWHYMFGYAERRNASIFAFILVWIFLIIMIFSKSTLVKSGFILSSVLTVAVGCSFLFSFYQLNYVPKGVVTSIEADVRKGPGNSYEQFYTEALPSGTEFRVVEEQGDWWKIRLVNDDEVWVNSEFADRI